VLAFLIFLFYNKGIFILISTLLPYAIFEYFFTIYHTRNNLEYYILEQLKDVFIVVFLSVTSVLIVYFLGTLFSGYELIKLILLGLSFALIYVSISYVLKVKGLVYILELIKK
jgi:hypothetical protein